MKKILAAICLMAISSTVHAGGSASQAQILKHLPGDLRAMLTNDFSLAEAGSCVRAADGRRLLPCKIEGTYKRDGKRYMISVNYSLEQGEVTYDGDLIP